MTTEPDARIAEALTQSSTVLQEALAGISEADAVRKPDGSRWSVRDCVEHLVLAERGMLGRVLEAEPGVPLPEDPARGAEAIARVASRGVRVEAPARALPSGRFSTLAEAFEQFQTARRDTLGFLREHASDLALRTPSHPFFGALTGAEMLLIMATHTRRHSEQIREIRARITQ